MSDNEAFYDEVIAPELMRLAKLCEEKGMAMQATVEYAPGLRGSTRLRADDECLEMTLLRILDMAGRNIDGFMMAVKRHCDKEGIDTSASIYLTRF